MDLLDKYPDLYKGQRTLIGASSSNFALALDALGEVLGLRIEVHVGSKASNLTLKLLKQYGATVHQHNLSTEGCDSKVKEIVASDTDTYIDTDQLNNWENPAGYEQYILPMIRRHAPTAKTIYLSMGSGGGVWGIGSSCNEIGIQSVVTTAIEGGIPGTIGPNDVITPFIALTRRSGFATECPITLAEAREGMDLLRKETGIAGGLSAGGVYYTYKKRKEEFPGDSIVFVWDGMPKWI